MGLMWTVAFAHLLLSVLRTEAVTVESKPSHNGGLIQTKLAETVTLKCTAASSGGELQWFRNGQVVTLNEENRVNESHLCVHPVTRQDNGAVFLCQLKNDAAHNHSVELNVKYTPDLSGHEMLSVEEDSDLSLSCDSRANPPVTMVWHRNNQLLDLSDGRFTATNNGVTAHLSATNVKRHVHEGNYSCVAKLTGEGQLSKTFVVTVTDKTMKFPRDAMIAGIVVLVCTALLAVLARWDKISKCCK